MIELDENNVISLFIIFDCIYNLDYWKNKVQTRTIHIKKIFQNLFYSNYCFDYYFSIKEFYFSFSVHKN